MAIPPFPLFRSRHFFFHGQGSENPARGPGATPLLTYSPLFRLALRRPPPEISTARGGGGRRWKERRRHASNARLLLVQNGEGRRAQVNRYFVHVGKGRRRKRSHGDKCKGRKRR